MTFYFLRLLVRIFGLACNKVIIASLTLTLIQGEIIWIGFHPLKFVLFQDDGEGEGGAEAKFLCSWVGGGNEKPTFAYKGGGGSKNSKFMPT